MNHLVSQSVRLYALLPVEQEEKLLSLLKPLRLKKGQHFLKEGDIPRKFGFVQQGFFRYYYSDAQGKELTKAFFPEGTFISSYSAMIQQRASYYSIQALVDSQLWVVDYERWKELLAGHPCWSQFLIGLLEKGYATKEARERELLLLPAEDRYWLFLQQFPELEKRLKKHMIASYLGITPIALSRIRRKMGFINLG